MRYINYLSDFEFYQKLGNAQPAPFELTYYIPGKEQKLIASFNGEEYTNCRPEGNGIIVSVDYSQAQLGIGKIRCTARYYLNNEHYKDGIYEPVSDFEIGIELHRGKSDDMANFVATPLPSYHVIYAGEGGGGYQPPVGGVSFEYSPMMSKSSLLYIIEHEAAAEPITRTLHASAYARLSTDPDIVEALSNHPLVTLASA